MRGRYLRYQPRFHRLATVLLAAAALPTAGGATFGTHSRHLSVDDGASAGMRSIAGTGHAVRLQTASDSAYLQRVSIYGSRYGTFEAPAEDFRVWLCDAEFNVIAEFRFPLARFERGDPQWVDLEMKPTKVPREFIICVGFAPTQYKGVYVHFDSQGSGNAFTGLPGRALEPFAAGDWMIRADVDQAPSDISRGIAMIGRWRAFDAIYLLNVAFAAVAIAALALWAARAAGAQRLKLRHGLLCSALGLLLVCPPALAVMSRWEVGAIGVGWQPLAGDPRLDEAALGAAELNDPNRHEQSQPARANQESDRLAGNADRETPAALARPRGLIAWSVRLVALVWLAGAIFVISRWARGMAAIRRLRRSMEPADGPRLAALRGRAFRAAGLGRDVPICTSPLAPGPLALGIWRPAIVLPAGLEDTLGDDELVCVLAHEGGHVARRDALVGILERLAAAVFWWNPLVHAINRRIRYVRECLCDDCAVRACGDADHLAAALLEVTDWCFSPSKRLAAAAAMTFDEDNLRNRITRLTQGVPTMAKRSNLITAAAFLTLAVVAPAFVLVPVLRAEPARRGTQARAASFAQAQADRLSYNDGTAESKRSIAGTGEMIEFTLPDSNDKVAGIRIHGARYGTPQAPKESVMIYLLSADTSEVVATQPVPYSRFKRGPEGWVTVRFPKPVEVPKQFWVCVDFRAAATKGVYVSIDESTDGSHSRVGLPGGEAKAANIGGDWMIEALLAK